MSARRTPRTVTVLVLGVLAMAAVTGCGSSRGADPTAAPSTGALGVEESRTAVQDAVRSVAATAAGLGLDLAEATGSWSACSADPPRLKYRAGGAATPTSGTAADGVAALSAALQDGGWSVDDSGTSPEAYAVLVRDDLRADLGESRRTAGAVSVSVTASCVETERDELLGEQDAVIGGS